MRIQIEKDVPLPNRRKESKYNYPFDDMVIGDSFFVQGEGRELSRFKAHVSTFNCRRRNAGIFGKYWTVRTVEGGVRCWCVPSPCHHGPFDDEDDF